MVKVAIHSVPRSGSTWVGQIFNSHPEVAYRYQPLFSYAFKDRLTESSSLEEINGFYDDILDSKDKFLLQIEEGSLSKNPTIFKKNKPITHIVYKEVRYNHLIENLLIKDNDIKVIGIVRNPKAVMNSWLSSPREFRNDLGWDLMKEWRSAASKNQAKKEEFYGFEKWKEVTQLFLRLQLAYPKNFYLLKYNDLLEETTENIEELFSFTGLEMVPSTQKFLEESRGKNDQDAYSVFKSHKIDNAWKKSLDPRIISEIDADLKNSQLQQFIT